MRNDKDEIDKKLNQTLRNELPGILNWSLQGCILWQREGIEPPESVDHATQEYRNEANILQDFLEEKCIIGDGYEIKSADLFAAYEAWCNENHDKNILSVNSFGRKIKDLGFDKTRKNDGDRKQYYIGIKLI